MGRRLDCLIIASNASQRLYQGLAAKHTSVEPPHWGLLLAQGLRARGYGVAILDCLAEGLNEEQALARIEQINPRIACFPVFGPNVNAGTTQMTGALSLANAIKQEYPHIKTAFLGTHTSAVPLEVLSYRCVDFVCPGDGFYALANLVGSNLRDVRGIQGLGWKDDFGLLQLDERAQIVEEQDLDRSLPGYAFDLLPFREKPFDLYRSANWHGQFVDSRRTPYASLLTQLGCRFKCSFCCINLINRTDLSEGVVSADSAVMRYWSTEWVMRAFRHLVDHGVKTIRLVDEMFLLNEKRFGPILDALIQEGLADHLNLFAYSRADTCKPRFLERLHKAGVRWLGIGVESGDQTIRQEVSKGSFEDVNIEQVINSIHASDIDVVCNVIYGLPGDTHASMERTYRFAEHLNCAHYNAYGVAALPGTPLWREAKEKGWELPDSFEAYSFHSWECLPLRTENLTAAEILRFRDNSIYRYFSRPKYQSMIERKFGVEAVEGVRSMLRVHLPRKILGDPNPRA